MSKEQNDLLARASESTRRVNLANETLARYSRLIRALRDVIAIQHEYSKPDESLCGQCSNLIMAVEVSKQPLDQWLEANIDKHNQLMVEVLEGVQ